MENERRMTYAAQGPIHLGDLRDFLVACSAPAEAVVEVNVKDRGNRLPQEWWATVRWSDR